MNGATLNGLLSTPLAIPASVAGALAALFVVLLLLSLKRAGPGMARLLMAFVALAVFAAAVTVLVDRMANDGRGAERRAILARNIALTAGALAPGSVLSCLDASAGEPVENSCEKAVFATPQGAAGAVAYMGARLTLLAQVEAFAQDDDPAMRKAFAAIRRSIELDRYGLAAQVLAERDGCTAIKCPAFALVRDATVLKANLRVHAFDTYVARYAGDWNKPEPKPAPVAAVPQAATPAMASAPEPTHRPVPSKYDFPSAASIPPVSIMNAEPPLPKESAAPAAEAPLPVPPKHPQRQAADPPAR